MKKFLAVISITLLALVIVACGSNEEDNSQQNANGDHNNEEGSTSEESTSTNQDLYEQIKEEGVLRVGTEGTYPPYTFHDENDNLTGYDVEVAREVGERLGVDVKFMETKWDSIFAGLSSKRFDMIANQVGIKPKRKEKYDFTTPYTISTAVLVAEKGNDTINSFDDLEGVTAAQSLTSNFADIAKEYGAEVTGVEGFNAAMQLIATGRADATVNDRLSVLNFIKEKGDNAQVEIVDREDEASESAFMVRKGNDKLVEAVNGVMKEMKEDGTLAEISKEWFGEDVSTN